MGTLIFIENIQKRFREIAFLAVLNFFPTSNIDFWQFLKFQKKKKKKKFWPTVKC